MAETLSKFFVKAADKLDIKEFKSISNINGLSDPGGITINHPSIIAITEKFNFNFEFEEVNLKDIEKEILNLNTKYLKKRLASIALCFSKYGTMKF